MSMGSRMRRSPVASATSVYSAGTFCSTRSFACSGAPAAMRPCGALVWRPRYPGAFEADWSIAATLSWKPPMYSGGVVPKTPYAS